MSPRDNVSHLAATSWRGVQICPPANSETIGFSGGTAAALVGSVVARGGHEWRVTMSYYSAMYAVVVCDYEDVACLISAASARAAEMEFFASGLGSDLSCYYVRRATSAEILKDNRAQASAVAKKTARDADYARFTAAMEKELDDFMAHMAGR